MTIEIAIVLFIILLAFTLFVTEALPIDVTALSILGLLLVCNFISPTESIKGFSNPAVITIAALFILSHALQKSGILEYLIIRLNRLASHSIILGLSVYLISIAIASAFVNNTAIVAIFMPVTIRMAQKYNISPSKVLIPLSYAAILGGTLTLVGTSTNLLVNSILMENGDFKSLGMFEFSKYGLVQLTIGLTYILAVVYRVLPSRTVSSSLTKSYHMAGFLTEVKVTEDSPLVGRTCFDRNLNQNYDVMVLNILRNNNMLSGDIRNTKIKEDDILFVRGSLENFLRMKEVEKITLLTDEKLTQSELTRENNILVECLVTNDSSVVGNSLMEVNFRQRYGSFVLAIRREGAILRRKIAHVVLRAFDTILVYGSREKIQTLANSKDFIVLEEIERELQKHRFWWLSIVVILGVVLLAAVGVITILKGALLGCIILLIFRVINANEAYQSIHWPVIILIASLIPLGMVIQSSGTADWLGGLLLGFAELFPVDVQPRVMLGIIYLVTIFLTEVSSNAATAIIMTPIALAASSQMGLDPRPFIFAICYAASASFITPVGYQTNLMVYGPGGYKFTDFMKVGFPIAITLWIIAMLLIPVIWPFTSV